MLHANTQSDGNLQRTGGVSLEVENWKLGGGQQDVVSGPVPRSGTCVMHRGQKCATKVISRRFHLDAI